MNFRIVLVVAFALVLLSSLFPPRKRHPFTPDGNFRAAVAPRTFLYSDELYVSLEGANAFWAEIDAAKMLGEWGMIAGGTALLATALVRSPNPDRKEKTAL